MIIFESILTTFEASFIFRGSWGICKNWPELKIEPPSTNLACLNTLTEDRLGQEYFKISYKNFFKWNSRLFSEKYTIVNL